MAGDNAPDNQVSNRNEQGQFVPGVSGNPAGRPPMGNSLTEIMRKFLEEIPPGQTFSYKDAFVRKVYKLAMEDGSESAIKLIWNYIDGMPTQKNELTGADGEKLSWPIVYIPTEINE